MKVFRAVILVAFGFCFGAENAFACNIQMGFPDSCYKNTPRGTEYGTTWGPGYPGQVVPGTESAREQEAQQRRAREKAARDAEIRRQQEAQVARDADARRRVAQEAQEREDAARQKQEAAETKRKADKLRAEQEHNAELAKALQERKRLEDEAKAAAAEKGGGMGITLLALSIGVVGAFVKQKNPQAGKIIGVVIPIGILLVYVVTGIELKDQVTLAQVPLIPIGGGALVGILAYKLHA
jgi:hypothetical protein